jgi:hypothetical protein
LLEPGKIMQQFARVLTDKGIVPVILKGEQPLDLRPVVADITADALAWGALADVDTAGLSPVAGIVAYLAPIDGIRQIAATLQLQEAHRRIPHEAADRARGVPQGNRLPDWTIRPDLPRPQ